MGDSSVEDACNTLRVLVATDCHLGYMEKDEIRRFDSFRAFEEICSIAEEKEVDFILLGGDLFHENKPSRATLVKTIEIIRRYSLNDRPVQFQIVSDQTINFENMFGHVNYEDPHFNVGLPVFTIHGNHDDPAGVDNLSAIDILSTCNLVNYFGKMVLGGSAVGQIRIHPILIRKGTTSMALYGLGNIRDERLNRMFQTPHSIQWIRPQSQEDCQLSDWFNILVLHQNRIKSNPKNAINEHFLPRFLDFIVWGHEHECLVDPMEVPGMGFHITQPGSSVATSLIEGEAKPKHILLLEVKGTQYRSTKIPLTSVRPFEYFEVVLKDVADVNPNDQDSVLEYLDKLVIKMIEKCSRLTVSKPDLKLPLVRIKVDYSGFMTINPQRFGQKYVGKVANPQDILIFSKSVKKRQSLNESDEKEQLRPEELNQQNIEALVAESNLVDDETDMSPVLAPKKTDPPKQEPADITPSKPTPSASGKVPTAKSVKSKRKHVSEDANKNAAASKKIKTDSESKQSTKDHSIKSTASIKSSSTVLTKSASTSSSGPVTEREIRNVLLTMGPMKTQDLVAKFKPRLQEKKDKNAFADILKRISKIQKINGSSYVVLKDK